MRQLRSVVILMVIFPIFCLSQEDSLEYFPLHVGDVWQYVTYRGMEESRYETTIMSADTSFTDSTIIFTAIEDKDDVYYKTGLNDKDIIYWKRDSTDEWSIFYKLKAQIDENWVSYPNLHYRTIYKGEFQETIFNQLKNVKKFWLVRDTTTTLPFSVDYLAQGIGLYKYEFEVGVTYLQGCIIDGEKYGTLVGVEENLDQKTPNKYKLSNYPNPFNGQTQIYYTLPSRKHIEIKIFSILGREVKTIYSGDKEAGNYAVNWKPTGLASGTYITVLKTPRKIITHKLIYIK